MPGCGAHDAVEGVHTFRHASTDRHYRLQLPQGYDGSHRMPLILAFHGWGGDENEFLDDAHVRDDSRRRGYVVVAPRGLGSGAPDQARNSWTFRGSASGIVGSKPAEPICDTSTTPDYRYASCRARVAENTCSWTQCQDDDVAFVASLIAHLKETLCIDPTRIYATGGSNGGMFTWELGMNPATAPAIRAIAPIIGLPHAGDLRPPGRAGGMPVLLITGERDPVVPPGRWDELASTVTSNDHDRFRYTGASAIVRTWSVANGCRVEGLEHPVGVGEPEAECRTYCTAGHGRLPRVLDCRAPMAHDYGLPWAWGKILDFFDSM